MGTRLIGILLMQVAAIACWVGCDQLKKPYFAHAEYEGFLLGFHSAVNQISSHLCSKNLLPDGARLATGEMDLSYPDAPVNDYDHIRIIYSILYPLAWFLSVLACLALLVEAHRCRRRKSGKSPD